MAALSWCILRHLRLKHAYKPCVNACRKQHTNNAELLHLHNVYTQNSIKTLCATKNHLNHYVQVAVYSSAASTSATKSKEKTQKEANIEKKKRKEAKRLAMIEKTRLKEQRMKESKKFQGVKYTSSTLAGEKKDTCCPLPETYQPQYVEAAWYDWWQKSAFFKPPSELNTPTEHSRSPFVLCLPPPNVTGSLHLGHALTAAVQDAIVRWHRMHGRPVLWVPGCDHAGIATQVVVEKKLCREKQLSRWDVGREKFIEEVWRWKNEKGIEIYDQLKHMGCSLEWERACFTMDPQISKATAEAFVRLHDEGLIYRSQRFVNWCCTLDSVISDIEVDHVTLAGPTKIDVPGYDRKVQFGTLTSFAYPVVNSNEEVVVATTRIETMLGDTAVAVHPKDSRYSHLIGQFLEHPYCDRLLPVVADESVNPEFGTGAVKITPSHDVNDFEVAKRHNLPSVQVIDNRGLIVEGYQQFSGLKRFHARNAILGALKENKLYRDTQPNPMTIPICSRSKDVIEPLVKSQWFVDCRQMAALALEVVEDGRLKLIPENYTSQWTEWLGNIQDWCISRQLWWGHRIPAYHVSHVTSSEQPFWVVGRSEEEAIKKACQQAGVSSQDITVTQDEDVLDTWFSSALFPFAMLGWPDKTPDLDRFYPTSLLETGSDILFFWVARMVMLGQKLTGALPFTEVLLHGILRDATGRKMSKSLGNVIDPMDVIQGKTLEELNARLESGNLDSREVALAKEGQRKDFPLGIPECGTDALRFTLCSYNFKAHFINMDIGHVKSYRNFCNKIWQAFRFTLKHLGPGYKPPAKLHDLSPDGLVNRWILGRLGAMLEQCDKNFQTYDLHLVTKALHNFWYAELCDVYLECIKPVLMDGSDQEISETRDVLYTCIHTALKATHPFMPYLTEELYQRLPRHVTDTAPSVCVSEYPQPNMIACKEEDIHGHIGVVQEIVSKILSFKKELNIVKTNTPVFFDKLVGGHSGMDISQYSSVIQTLAKTGQVTVDTTQTPEGVFPLEVITKQENGSIKIGVLLKGHVDPEQISNGLRTRHQKLQMDIAKSNEKLKKASQDSAKVLIHEKILQLEKDKSKLEQLQLAIDKISSW